MESSIVNPQCKGPGQTMLSDRLPGQERICRAVNRSGRPTSPQSRPERSPPDNRKRACCLGECSEPRDHGAGRVSALASKTQGLALRVGLVIAAFFVFWIERFPSLKPFAG